MKVLDRSMVCLVLAAGCGPAVSGSTDSSGGASGGAGGSTGGAQSSTSDSGGATSASASTSSSATTGETTSSDSSTGGLECPGIEDAPLSSETTLIRVTNDTNLPYYVGFEGSCRVELFTLLTPEGVPVPWHGRACIPSCEMVAAEQCFDCEACPPQTVLLLFPGATYELEWSPAQYVAMDFPLACDDTPCETTCDRRQPIAPGPYALQVAASLQCEGDGCTCDGVTDFCQVYPEVVSDPDVVVEVEVDLPTDVIEVSLQ